MTSLVLWSSPPKLPSTRDCLPNTYDPYGCQSPSTPIYTGQAPKPCSCSWSWLALETIIISQPCYFQSIDNQKFLSIAPNDAQKSDFHYWCLEWFLGLPTVNLLHTCTFTPNNRTTTYRPEQLVVSLIHLKKKPGVSGTSGYLAGCLMTLDILMRQILGCTCQSKHNFHHVVK